MWLTRISIKNPYFATMLMLALVVLGLFAVRSLPVEEYPDIRFPIAVVSTEYRGASPEVVESDVTRPLEDSLNTINGIKHINSYSFEGSSLIIVEFELSIDSSTALQDVRDKVSEAQGGLRREISAPAVSTFNPSDQPLMLLTLNSDSVSSRELTVWTKNILQKHLQMVAGVGNAKIIGGTNREIRISLKPLRLEALGLSVGEVADVVRAANSDYPAGEIGSKQQEWSVRVSGKLKNPADFAKLIVAQRANGAVYLSDVAEISDGIEEQSSLALYNGKPAVNMEVRAIRGANVIDVANRIKNEISNLSSQMPSGTKLAITYDNSEKVKHALNSVRDSLLEGAFLAILIVFLFLGSWRSTVITGLTLPVSLIGTLFAIQAVGFTLNLMTLMALSLSIGMLIDDAIVVRENIVRHAALGKTHYQAALDGTLEIGLAVFATTLTIIAVFLPVGFMGGIIGKFFHQFGFSVVIAVLISMLVSFTLDPMLSSIWHDPHHHGDHHKGPIGWVLDAFERSLDKMTDHYQGVIEWALSHRVVVVLSAVFFTFACFALVFVIGGEFIPRSDKGQFSLTFKTAPGSSLVYTKDKAINLEKNLRKALPEIKSSLLTVGVGELVNSKNQAKLTIDVGRKNQRQRGLFSLMQVARGQAERIAGIRIISVEELGKAGGWGKPVNLSLRGNNLVQLQKTALKLQKQVANIKGITDLESSLSDANPSINVEVNRNAASSLGVDLSKVGRTLSILLAGDTVTTWEAPDGENYDVRMQIPKEQRASDLLNLLTVAGNHDATGGAKMVPLSALTSIQHSTSPRQIDRVDLKREVSITANIEGRKNGEVFTDINKMIQKFELPSGVSLDQQGESKDMIESLIFAIQALLMGIIFIYMILAAQFRSFTLPITIMMGLLLAFSGVFISLLLFGSTLNMFSIIGIVMLMGLSAKNGILLVDFINQARREGVARRQAIIEAGRIRLRPIMMTTLAMIFGMIPLAFSLGDGSETRAPMAHAIIGGLITSTILTLIVVPVVYTLFDDFSTWASKKFISKRADGVN